MQLATGGCRKQGINGPTLSYGSWTATQRQSFKTLTRGMCATLAREVPSFSLYFHTYYCMKALNGNPFISGGLAGDVYWLPTYPLDVIKTRVHSIGAKTASEALAHGKLWRGSGGGVVS